MPPTEKYLPVKELAFEIHARHGIRVSARFIREMMRAGAPRVGFNARLSDILAWWEAHPDFAPRSKRTMQVAA